MLIRLLFLLLLVFFNGIKADVSHIPTAYQGRIRPLESAARLSLYDLYHAQTLRSQGLTAVDFIWQLHQQGSGPWRAKPLLYVQHAETKELLGLALKESRFSIDQLKHAFLSDPQSNLRVVKLLVARAAADHYDAPENRSGATRLELTTLTPGLWTIRDRGDSVIVAAPAAAPWHQLKPGDRIPSDMPYGKHISDELMRLWSQLMSLDHALPAHEVSSNIALEQWIEYYRAQRHAPELIASLLEQQMPLHRRLQEGGADLRILPGRLIPGEWYSLRALDLRVYDATKDRTIPVENFTVYPDPVFNALREAYGKNDLETIAHLTIQGYAPLEGTVYQKAVGKSLIYPTLDQLQAEARYYQLPLPMVALLFYAVAAILLVLSLSTHTRWVRRTAFATLACAWLIHTVVLALRCYILARPPVATMFETVVYVPWIAVTLAYIYYWKVRAMAVPLAAAILTIALLGILEATQLSNGMEPLQPVLDSQYWLIIHVLLVVASYGVFLLAGVLGHLYLAFAAFKKRPLNLVARAILHTLYLGTFMLVSGTILGGVWAAQSWGRFWDWDPKESWAFISCCVYIIEIHLYSFRRIGDTGLAAGSIVGLWAISFTWYGVNYILGTGLHSYGFGSGGEAYYYSFLLVEVLFVAVCLLKTYSQPLHQSLQE